MPNRRLTTLLIAGVCVLIIGYLVWSTAGDPVTDVIRNSSSGSQAHATMASSRRPVKRIPAVSGGTDLVVLDEATGEPVENATVWPATSADHRTMDMSRPTVGKTDSNGRVALHGIGNEGLCVAITAQGHVALAVDVAPKTVTTVYLRQGHVGAVKVTDQDGTKVVGALVVLYAESDALAYTDSFKREGRGNPLSRSPVFVARTSEEGEAIFYGISAGRYAVAVNDPERCPGEARIVCAIPGPPVSVVLRSFYGIVIAAPSESSIKDSSFLVDISRLVKSPCVRIRRSRAQAILEDKFPGCEAFVVLPEFERPLPVKISASLEDGSRLAGSWVLRRVDLIDAPVFMDLVSAPGLGRLRVVMKHQGKTIDNIGLTATSARGRLRTRVQSGASISLPPGDYWLTAPANLGWLDDVVGDRRIHIQADGPTVVEIELPWPLIRVEVRPSTFGETYDVPIHIYLSHAEMKRSGVSPNWRPKAGPLVFWFPPGKVTITAEAAHFVTVAKMIDIVGDERDPVVVSPVLHRSK